MLRWALGLFVGLLVRLWAATWRVRIYKSSELDFASSRPFVFVFWHGGQMALTAVRARRTTNVLVSLSLDGDIQSGVMRMLGLRVLRGSSSKGGAPGLKKLIRHLKHGQDAALAVDGPRGPRGSCKPGAVVAARLAAADCVPLGAAASRSVTLRKTWDKFEIPLPFARVAVWMGTPLGNENDRQTELSVAEAIAHANACAKALLAHPRLREKEPSCRRS